MTFDNWATPFYCIDESIIESNLAQLKTVKDKTGCQILLATKAYSCYHTYPLIASYLDGTANSSLYEARLSHETFGKQTHVYSPAYRDDEFDTLMTMATSIVFNSLTQYHAYIDRVPDHVSVGLRLNPEHVEVKNELYSPCAPGSRFGIRQETLEGQTVSRIDGVHIHALCQNHDESLVRLMNATETKFKSLLMSETIKWVNFGGGHMIPCPTYNAEAVCQAINKFQKTYTVTVMLEPGEAVVHKAGVLVATVLDCVVNTISIAILDTSATAHMPDILEMPYRPEVRGAGKPGEYPYTYRLGGNTCLSGDSMGEYSFKEPLQRGDTIIFEDMAPYTMVKNTHFNGIRLPDIVIKETNGSFKKWKTFDYEVFKRRL